MTLSISRKSLRNTHNTQTHWTELQTTVDRLSIRVTDACCLQSQGQIKSLCFMQSYGIFTAELIRTVNSNELFHKHVLARPDSVWLGPSDFHFQEKKSLTNDALLLSCGQTHSCKTFSTLQYCRRITANKALLMVINTFCINPSQ